MKWEVAAAVRSSMIPGYRHQELIQTNSRTSQVYGLPKINAPLRQIVKGIHLQHSDILVRFDVTSLFTKVPINEALEVTTTEG
ncbi:hypothetical protein NQ315_000682 [Exocentrus adspersus]|uniref:Reverse transcriptase domain-containing protein n=1 Tax=Exocentrus adspersus TaxID=1586481 RepID=A0AAV8VF66_9CUCU|nr:hypothetical protein NQ315_000682 [Exocentrus adspersus]